MQVSAMAAVPAAVAAGVALAAAASSSKQGHVRHVAAGVLRPREAALGAAP